MVHRYKDDEDRSGSVRPCPLPPKPSKKRSDSNPQTDSLKLVGLRRRGWAWLMSSQFGGCCGIGGTISILLSWYIALISWGNLGIHPFQPFSLAHLFHGVGTGLLGIFCFQVLRVQKRYRSLLGMLGGIVGLLLSFIMFFNALIRREYFITLVFHRLTWVLVVAFPMLLGLAFSSVLNAFDNKSAMVYILALVMSICVGFIGLWVIAQGFIFLNTIQNLLIIPFYSSFLILYAVLLVIREKPIEFYLD